MNQHLFLFGSGPPINPQLAIIFSDLSFSKKGPVCILFIERDGWQEYMSKVTEPLRNHGITDFHFLPLLAKSVENIITAIEKSSAIIILGGNTNDYADRIVDTPLAKAIQDNFMQGKPVAGFSAGALISPKYCIISPKDKTQQKFQVRKGLNLVSDIVIAVHLTEWNDEQHLLKIAQDFPNLVNFGIDEKTGIYLKNGKLALVEGRGVYQAMHSKLVKIL